GQFGPLALALQVKGDVALAHARHNGLHVRSLKRIEDGLRAALQKSEARPRADKDARQCFKWHRLKPGGVPEVRPKALETWPSRMLATVRGLHATEFSLPRRHDSGVSVLPEDWEPLARSDPLLRAWYELMAVGEVIRSWVPHGSSPLRPDYEVLPRI